MPETRPVHLGIIIGSLRAGSFSRCVARALAERLPENWSSGFIEIGELALYNQDLDETPPQPWTQFRDAVRGVDALLFVTPEYNRSIPGVLKNAIDIGSRPHGQNVFGGKPAAIASTSPATTGGMAANHALRQPFVYLDLAVMQQPEAYFREVNQMVDAEGKATGEAADKILRGFIAGFVKWVARVGIA